MKVSKNRKVPLHLINNLYWKLMHYYSNGLQFFCLFLAQQPQWAKVTPFTRFLDHTRRTTVCRTPPDEWSSRRRALYLTTHNTHNRHPCPQWDSNPQSQQASGRRPRPKWSTITEAYSKELSYAVTVRSKSSQTLSTYCYQFVTFWGTGHIALAVAEWQTN